MAANNERSWKKVAVIGLIYVIAFFVLAKESWVVEQMTQEQQMARLAMGEERAEAAIRRATGWYERTFVDSGIQANSFRLLVPNEEEKRLDPKPQVSAPLWNFVEQRLRVLWTIIYQAQQRASMALVWVPVALLMMLAFGVDGMVARKIKQTNFDYTSPVRHRYSVLAIDAAVALFLLALFAPMAISPVALPAFFLLLAISLAILMANVQKKV